MRTDLCATTHTFAQVFESLGGVIGEATGQAGVAIGVTLASMLSQTLVIAGGFYKTVTFPLFSWLAHINGIKYGFTAIARLCFSHTDSFWTQPSGAMAVRDYTWASLERMGAFTTLKTRGITIVDSANPPGVDFPIAMLIVLIVGFRSVTLFISLSRNHPALNWKLRKDAPKGKGDVQSCVTVLHQLAGSEKSAYLERKKQGVKNLRRSCHS